MRNPCAATLLLLFGCPLSTALAQDVNAAHVTGRFVDGEGAPVADAPVLHRVWPGAEFPCRTDAEGRFSATVEWPFHHRDTWYECSITHLGFERWKLSDDLQPGDERDLGTIALSPGGGVRGRVLGEVGPLAEASVRVVPLQHLADEPGSQPDGPGWGNVVGGGRSDEDGTFRITGLPPGTWGLWARHETTWWTSGSRFSVVAGEYTSVPDLVLELLPPSHQITGTVVGPDDEPIAGATVKTGIPQERFILSVTTTTDEQGRFKLYLPELPGGRLELDAKPPGDEYWTTSRDGIRSGARGVVLRLPRMREVELKVVDVKRRPVEVFGWQVRVDHRQGITTWLERDANHPGGRAVFRIPEGLSVEIEVRSAAYEDAEVGEVRDIQQPISVTLTPLPLVLGTVTFEGKSVPKAHVEYVFPEPDYLDGLIENGRSGLRYSTGCTDADEQGRFRLSLDFPHVQKTLRVWAPGYAPTLREGVQAGDDVTIELAVGATIEGTVLLPPGGPPQGIVVRAFRTRKDSLSCDHGRQFQTTIAADGAYRFEQIEPGPWMIVATIPPGLAQEMGWSEEDVEACAKVPLLVCLNAGEVTRADLDLRQPRGGCRLRGRLVVGDQITEGYCYLRAEGSPALRLPTGGVDKQGRFALATRTPGQYRLVIHAGPGHYQYQFVTDLVELSRGETVWEREIAEEDWKDGERLDAK